MKHLTYYVIVYCDVPGVQNEVDYLQYGTFEEMLNFLDESRKEYLALGYCAVVTIFKEGEQIDKITIEL